VIKYYVYVTDEQILGLLGTEKTNQAEAHRRSICI